MWLVEAGEETAGQRVAPHELELCRICRLCDIPGLELVALHVESQDDLPLIPHHTRCARSKQPALDAQGSCPGQHRRMKRRKQSDHNYREYRRRIASHGQQLRAKRLRRESPSRIWCVEQLETAALSPMPAVQWWRSDWCSRRGLEPALR